MSLFQILKQKTSNGSKIVNFINCNCRNFSTNVVNRQKYLSKWKRSTPIVKVIRPKEGNKYDAVRATSNGLLLPLLKKSPQVKHFRRRLPKRTGLLAYKVGMINYFSKDGIRMPSTLLHVDRNQIIQVRTPTKDGYWGIVVGCGERNPKNVNRAQLGTFAKVKIPTKMHLRQFHIQPLKSHKTDTGAYVASDLPKEGQYLTVSHFIKGSFVDVKAKGKGKGFAGVMKRHGFSGLPASHGTTLKHRSAGSTGASTTPGRVYPGKKMAGRMGGHSITTRNLQILDIDEANSTILVKGVVPGPNKGLVKVFDSIFK